MNPPEDSQNNMGIISLKLWDLIKVGHKGLARGVKLLHFEMESTITGILQSDIEDNLSVILTREIKTSVRAAAPCFRRVNGTPSVLIPALIVVGRRSLNTTSLENG